MVFILASLTGVPAIHLYYEHKGKGIAKYIFGIEGCDPRSYLNGEHIIREILKILEDLKT